MQSAQLNFSKFLFKALLFKTLIIIVVVVVTVAVSAAVAVVVRQRVLADERDEGQRQGL